MPHYSLLLLVFSVSYLQGFSVGEKPFTLKLPMIAPLGGSVIPTGAICTEGINFALDAINKNKNILPNYKLVIDIADDRCEEVTGIRRMLSFFENLAPEVLTEKTYGDTVLPNSNNVSLTNLGTSYVPPLFLGSICSGVCKATARLPQHFKTIYLASGCNDPLLTERSRYPNFYRFSPSLVQSGVGRIKMMDYMSWNKIAILSDTFQSSYTDTLYFMKSMLQFPKFSISMEEFFISDPSESIARMKQADVRIIFASCFVNTCPLIACSAYRQGFYGPRIVWMLNTNTDLLAPNIFRPEGCTKDMTDAFAEHTLAIGGDFTSNFLNPDLKTDIGITLRQFNSYLAEKVPNLERSPAFGWRFPCIISTTIAAHILDSVERQLNLGNETLKDVILKKNRLEELSELIRRNAVRLNVTTLWGLAAFQPGSVETYEPPIGVEQVQGGVRKITMYLPDRTIEDGKKAFQVVRELVWGFPDDSAPRSEPLAMNNYLIAYSETVYGIYGLHVALILIMWTTVCLTRHYQNELGENTYQYHNFLAVTGATVVLFAIFTFSPNSKISHTVDIFCATVVPMVIIGFSLLCAPLLDKLWQLAGSGNKIASKLTLVSWIALNTGLIIAWYYNDNWPSSNELTWSRYNAVEDIIWSDKTFSCTVNGSGEFFIAILALQCAFVVFGLFISARANRAHRTGHNSRHALANNGATVANTYYSAGVTETIICLYIIFSITAVCSFAVFIFRNSQIALFGILVAFSVVVSLAITFVLHRTTFALLLSKAGIGEFNYHPCLPNNNNNNLNVNNNMTLNFRTNTLRTNTYTQGNDA